MTPSDPLSPAVVEAAARAAYEVTRANDCGVPLTWAKLSAGNRSEAISEAEAAVRAADKERGLRVEWEPLVEMGGYVLPWGDETFASCEEAEASLGPAYLVVGARCRPVSDWLPVEGEPDE